MHYNVANLQGEYWIIFMKREIGKISPKLFIQKIHTYTTDWGLDYQFLTFSS